MNGTISQAVDTLSLAEKAYMAVFAGAAFDNVHIVGMVTAHYGQAEAGQELQRLEATGAFQDLRLLGEACSADLEEYGSVQGLRTALQEAYPIRPVEPITVDRSVQPPSTVAGYPVEYNNGAISIAGVSISRADVEGILNGLSN
jgi:hypothetical protein